ncbi:MAG: DUF5309 family protein [Phycisphaeraceae bacterium]
MAFTGKATYSAGSGLPELAEDVSDIIGIVSPYETPLLDHLGDAQRSAASTVHEWLEDELLPNTDELVDAITDSQPGLIVANVERFRVGDQVQIEGKREVMLVTELVPNDDTVTVVRGYGGTEAETASGGATIRILGNAALEGADAPEARFTNRRRQLNYTQIFTSTVEVSGSQLAARQVAIDDEMDYQKQERLRELLRDLENCVINGVAATDDAHGGASTRRTMRGILPGVESNVFEGGEDGFPSGDAGKAAARGAVMGAEPVVLVEGVPEPGLRVSAVSMTGPTDLRQAWIELADAAGDASVARWSGREAMVGLPQRLVDGSVRWVVLAAGVLAAAQRREAAGQRHDELTLEDAWTRQLASPVAAIWWAGAEGALRREHAGTLEPGPGGNRSAARFEIGGERVHLPAGEGGGGGVWTLGDALESVSALADLGLELSLLPTVLEAAPLTARVNLARPVGDVLTALLASYGLIVRREMSREGATLIERRVVRPLGHGRCVRLSRGGGGRRLSDLLRVDIESPARAAEAWVAQGAGWQIESTFELVGGWSPALEGEADAAYDRQQSDDFATYRNVYRQWVLNEDGGFSGLPYERERIDLGVFYGRDDLRAQALPFERCVTRDDAGQAREPVVEVSTNAGANWSQYPGQAAVLGDRAGVYLSDDALPAAFLDAAKAGTARVRVTASLTCPRPVERVRWRGNPFAGGVARRELDVRQAYHFRRVDAGSIHHDAVRASELAADEVDQGAAMERWLVDRMREADVGATEPTGRGRLTLGGSWAMLRVGDRLIEPGEAATVEELALSVWSLRCEFAAGSGSRSGPVTRVEVRF